MRVNSQDYGRSQVHVFKQLNCCQENNTQTENRERMPNTSDTRCTMQLCFTTYVVITMKSKQNMKIEKNPEKRRKGKEKNVGDRKIEQTKRPV